jgi:hypothetical protein
MVAKLRLEECFPATEQLEGCLSRRHEFLYHRAKVAAIDEIKHDGLIPLFKPPAIDTDVELLRHATGTAGPTLICFASESKACSIELPDDEPRVMLRVRTAEILRNRLALDWTWDGCWTHALEIRKKWPAISPTELFLMVFEDLGSLACLAPVLPGSIWIQNNKTASIAAAEFVPLKSWRSHS